MKLRDKQFWLYEAVIIICAAISMVVLWANHLLFHILFGVAFCSLFFYRWYHGVETIQRQPMVETGRIYASRHNRDSCHCAVRFCVGLA